MAERSDDVASATSHVSSSSASSTGSSSKPSRLSKLPSFRDRDKEKDGSSSGSSSLTKLMDYMRDRGKDKEEDGSSSSSLTSKLFKSSPSFRHSCSSPVSRDRDRDKDKEKDGSSSSSHTSKFFSWDRDKDRDKDKDKDKEKTSKLFNFSPSSRMRSRTPSGKSISMDSEDTPTVPPPEVVGQLAPVKEEVVVPKDRSGTPSGGIPKESGGSPKEGGGVPKEKSSAPKEEGGVPKEEGGASKEEVIPLKERSASDGSAKEVGEEKQEKEETEPRDTSPPATDPGIAAVKKKEKEKRGFFSPRHRGSLFPFAQIFTTSHKQKNAEIHKIFSSLPETEKLIDDFSCALQRDILIHGRLYLTQNWLCFYANIFSWETLLTIPFQSVQGITKEKTALVIPNAIQISTTAEKYGFSSLVNRDVTHNIIVKIWQSSLLPQPLSPLELVRVSKKVWGESTDVGTEDDLWGNVRKKRNEKVKQMSMPTHVELGVLPTPTIPSAPTSETSPQDRATDNQSDATLTGHSADERATMSMPPRLVEEAKDVRADRSQAAPEPPKETVVQANGSDSGHVSGSSAVPTPRPPDNPETVSLQSVGGESIASSEYETLSFTDEQGEIPCGCSEHLGRTILNEIYDTDVETLFQLCFTDSEFIRSVFKARKAINLEIGEWQTQTDGTRLRDISYTLALNYSFGPKFATSTEHHTYSKMGQPGLKHIVDSEVANGNIPYSDTFYVSCRFCITRVAHDKTRLRISANINFKKSCWGLVKNLIEKNAGDGIRSHYSCMDTLLKEYLAAMPVVKRKRPHRRVTRRSRHRRQSSITKPPSPPPVSAKKPSTSPQGALAHRRGSVVSALSAKSALTAIPDAESEASKEMKRGASHSLPRVNMALTLLLGILIVSNMALYHHLMSYQSTGLPPPATPPPTVAHMPHQRIEWPMSKSEWIGLVRQQLEGHDEEMRHWHSTLSSLVESLEQIETSVSDAKKVLVTRLQSYDPALHAQKEWDSIASAVRKKTAERAAEKMEPSLPPKQVPRRQPQTELAQEEL